MIAALAEFIDWYALQAAAMLPAGNRSIVAVRNYYPTRFVRSHFESVRQDFMMLPLFAT